MPSLIIQIDAATTNVELDNIVDEPKFLSLINASGWNTTIPINSATKNEFLQKLIHEEVLLKRLPAMDAFSKGLETLGVITLLRKHSQLKELFLHVHKELTADMFASLTETPVPTEVEHTKIYKWFLEFIKAREMSTSKYYKQRTDKNNCTTWHCN